MKFGFALLLICLANQMAAQNMLNNPGFEEGAGPLPTGWQHFQPDFESSFATDTQVVYRGAKAMRLTGVPGLALSLSSKEVAASGKAVFLSAWVCGRTSKGTCLLRLREVDSQGLTLR